MTLEHSYANTHIKMPTPLFKKIIDQIINKMTFAFINKTIFILKIWI